MNRFWELATVFVVDFLCFFEALFGFIYARSRFFRFSATNNIISFFYSFILCVLFCTFIEMKTLYLLHTINTSFYLMIFFSFHLPSLSFTDLLVFFILLRWNRAHHELFNWTDCVCECVVCSYAEYVCCLCNIYIGCLAINSLIEFCVHSHKFH